MKSKNLNVVIFNEQPCFVDNVASLRKAALELVEVFLEYADVLLGQVELFLRGSCHPTDLPCDLAENLLCRKMQLLPAFKKLEPDFFSSF